MVRATISKDETISDKGSGSDHFRITLFTLEELGLINKVASHYDGFGALGAYLSVCYLS